MIRDVMEKAKEQTLEYFNKPDEPNEGYLMEVYSAAKETLKLADKVGK